MAGVLMMMDGEFKNHSWDRAKKMMSNLGQFLEDLKTFPAEQMSDELMDKLEKIVENPVMDYDVMKKKINCCCKSVVLGMQRVYI